MKVRILYGNTVCEYRGSHDPPPPPSVGGIQEKYGHPAPKYLKLYPLPRCAVLYTYYVPVKYGPMDLIGYQGCLSKDEELVFSNCGIWLIFYQEMS